MGGSVASTVRASGEVTPETRRRQGRPPGSSSDATRQRILLAACRCFGERGYEAATNNEIGELAGVTGAALYRYFDSKQVLYKEAVGAAHREIVPLLREAVRDARGVRDGLAALARAYVETYRRFPALMPFLSGVPTEMARHPGLAAALMSAPEATLMTIVVELVELGVKQGEIARRQVPALISMAIAMTVGLSFQATVSGLSGLEEAAAGFAHLLEGTLHRATEGRAPGAPKARPRRPVTRPRRPG